jgi:hypothetical protein
MTTTRLGRDLAIVLGLKLIALAALYWLCFAPSHRPAIDLAAHFVSPPADRR